LIVVAVAPAGDYGYLTVFYTRNYDIADLFLLFNAVHFTIATELTNKKPYVVLN
jgi:hypothetical protein